MAVTSKGKWKQIVKDLMVKICNGKCAVELEKQDRHVSWFAIIQDPPGPHYTLLEQPSRSWIASVRLSLTPAGADLPISLQPCRFCSRISLETIQHILCTCSGFQIPRQKFFSSYTYLDEQDFWIIFHRSNYQLQLAFLADVDILFCQVTSHSLFFDVKEDSDSEQLVAHHIRSILQP